MKTLGFLGYGAFARFMAPHLAPHFALRAWNRTPRPSPEASSFEDAAAADVVVVAVTMGGFEDVVRRAAPHVRPGALVVDVASVKARPVELMREHVPAHADVAGLHPMFGPQSGADGLAGLKCAYCPVRIAPERLARLTGFLRDALKLETIPVDPDEHDRTMAKVQAATHFISRGLKALELGPTPLATKAYEQLLRFADTLLSDSWELFLTIENENPHAKAVRDRFRAALDDLERRLSSVPCGAYPGSRAESGAVGIKENVRQGFLPPEGGDTKEG